MKKSHWIVAGLVTVGFIAILLIYQTGKIWPLLAVYFLVVLSYFFKSAGSRQQPHS